MNINGEVDVARNEDDGRIVRLQVDKVPHLLPQNVVGSVLLASVQAGLDANAQLLQLLGHLGVLRLRDVRDSNEESLFLKVSVDPPTLHLSENSERQVRTLFTFPGCSTNCLLTLLTKPVTDLSLGRRQFSMSQKMPTLLGLLYDSWFTRGFSWGGVILTFNGGRPMWHVPLITCIIHMNESNRILLHIYWIRDRL